MGLLADFRSVADDLFLTFAEFTETVTLNLDPVYDPSTGEVASRTAQTFTAYVTDYTTITGGSRQIDGDSIQLNDKRIIAKNLNQLATPVTPKVGQKITWSGIDLEIIRVADMGTGGILTEIQARGV